MLCKINSYGLNGINGYLVRVESDVTKGLPGTEIVGLPDVVTKEAKERVRVAIKNSGYRLSPQRITINLAPADMKKEGSFYDLPIALGILYSTEQITSKKLFDNVFVGELSLNGDIAPINGVLPMIISARENGIKNIVIPKANEEEASYVSGINIYALSSLKEVAQFLESDEFKPLNVKPFSEIKEKTKFSADFKYVKGQYVAKRALEIAAAGGHNLLMIGPPGTGKTMLAKCLPTIMPDMTIEESLETTKIHSICGLIKDDGIVASRPFRAPHHTMSNVALSGGGTHARPGEISLAHNGVLFLDEFPEFNRSALEVLRQPMEDGVVNVARASRSVEYPANFMLLASMNPCPCGNFGNPAKECICTPSQINRYINKISGPLLDRIDLQIEVSNVTYEDIRSGGDGEESAVIKERVNKAREIQLKRNAEYGTYSNAQLTSEQMREYCKIDERAEGMLKKAFEKLDLSARGYNRVLKVARTIADLDNSNDITANHIAEALQYRSLDRSYFK